MVEIRSDALRGFREAAHRTDQILFQMFLVHGWGLASQLRFQIPVQILVWVTLWTVGGKVKQSYAILVGLAPFLDRGAVVNSQVVDNEKDFLLRILDQALHEADEDLAGERLLINHPTHHALVCYT